MSEQRLNALSWKLLGEDGASTIDDKVDIYSPANYGLHKDVKRFFPAAYDGDSDEVATFETPLFSVSTRTVQREMPPRST